jgi:UDP-N-acetylglucosamine--N-acetylmuramyl-(pentapeptide) pyrophosphoryl-undecaprenol N-acetylglucosamine transferase
LQLKFIISGGGTGGHIFPAVAIAKELRRRYPKCGILFIGANGRMEMEKVPLEGFDIIGLDVAGLKRSLSISNFNTAWKFIKSYFHAKKILKDFRPHCAIGTGGYASLAVLYAAGRMQIPTVIWEGNGHAGLTNKILAKRASVICTGLPEMDKFFPPEKTIFTGNPVREEIIHLPQKNAAMQFFGLDASKPVIFITGGSLGARTINESIQNSLQHLHDNHVQLIWQTGKNFEANTFGFPGIKALPFLKEMNMAYAASDLVISRAGALSISEISVTGKPSVLVPSPNVTDDHQTENALKLSEKGAAILIPDSEARDTLANTSIALLNDTARLQKMQEQVLALAKPNATLSIVDAILKTCHA